MKFRGHETFPIRKGWLNKGIRNVKAKPDVFISKTENPMDSLGIGANMVKGLRYWLQATKLTEERKSGQHVQALTEFGKIIYENDPYFEELGTLWLIHYALASNLDDATAWYIFFNAFDLIEFSEEDFEKYVKKYISMNAPDADIPSSRAITDDFKCIINTYYSKHNALSGNANQSPEDNLTCPLTELGLVSAVTIRRNERIYRKNMPKADKIPELIVLAAILNQYSGTQEIRISALQKGAGCIGNIFCLDTIALYQILYSLDQSGYLKVVRTAGLDVIKLKTEMSFIECVEHYYKELDEGQEINHAE